MVMKTANVAELKQNLSRYLRLVEQGDEVLVTSHHRPIARLVPEPGASGLDVRPPSLPLSALDAIEGVTPATPFSAGRVLSAERRRR